MLVCSPEVPKSNVIPPFLGVVPLKRQKVNIENACRPPVSLSADSGAGTINGDVTTICVNDKVDAFDGSQKSKVEYHNFNCLNEFSGCVDYAEAIDKAKPSRNDSSDLKSETCNGL